MMTRWRWIAAGPVFVGVLTGALTAPTVLAQGPSRPAESTDAVAALVAEVRALRADLAAASRNQLRAQLLLGRVQMQEQRLAYLDKQRMDAAAGIAIQAQLTSGLRNQVGDRADPCANMPNAEQRRDCEQNFVMLRRQLTDQEAREAQLRTQETELTNALAAEQARWSDFNTRLDELEQSMR